jgi:hypothetical protein
MAGALLEGVGRGQQAAVGRIDAQPDVDVAVILVPQAIGRAADRYAAALNL